MTGGAASPTHYQLVLKNAMTGVITPGCDVDFPASATAMDQDVEIPVAEEGVYQILSEVDGEHSSVRLEGGGYSCRKGARPGGASGPKQTCGGGAL